MPAILLAETDPLSLRVLDVSLRKAGFDVRKAPDMESALARLDDEVPDLLVVSARLAGGDGVGLARAMRGLGAAAADVPVIVLSSQDEGELLAPATDLADAEVMARPVFVRELIARAQLLIARRLQRSVASGSRAGTTDEVALVNLLQGLEGLRTTGVVHLERLDVPSADAENARIYVREGNVVNAELGRLRGAEVVMRALGWERAAFRVEPGPVDNDDLLECTTHALLMRAMDRLDGRTPTPEVIAHEEVRAAPDVAPQAAPEVPALASELPAIAPEVPAIARERSVPSTAPWTREAGASSELPAPELDIHAAGVPRARGRSLGRLGLIAAAAATAAVLAVGIGTMRGGARPVAAATGAPPETPDPAVPTQVAPPQTAQGVAPGVAAQGPDTEATTTTDGVAPGASAVAVGVGSVGDGPSGPGSVVPPPVVDVREKALDVKTVLHARSPLVRDADRALLQGDTDRAIGLAQKAVAANPADADAWLTLAAARRAAGDVAGAKDAYKQCIAKGFTVGVMSCRALAAHP